MNENIKMKGYITLEHIRDGKVIEHKEIPNLIVTAGKNEMAKLLVNSGSPSAFSYIALGSDDGSTLALAVGNTQLGTELSASGSGRASASLSTDGAVSKLEHTWTFSGAITVNESGIFNDSSSGVMLARQIIGSFTFANADQLKLTWEITFS